MSFDEFSDSTRVTDQYPGIVFEHATTLSSGVSLNEYDAHPRSGSNVIFDDGGPITITFRSMTKSCSAYLTYSHQITVMSYDEKGNVTGTVKSKFGNNLAVATSENYAAELLSIKYEQGIKQIRIIGADLGSSFTLDDLTVERPFVKARLVLHDHGQSRELTQPTEVLQRIEASANSLWKSTDSGKLLRLIIGASDIEKIKHDQKSLEFLFDEVMPFETGSARGSVTTVRMDRLLIPISGKHAQTQGPDQFLTLFYGAQHYGSGPYIATGEGVQAFLNLLREADLLK
ncbi:MAG TPA: hypothetical protein VI306_00750 [Pyrinomonadaceae bacterium]